MSAEEPTAPKSTETAARLAAMVARSAQLGEELRRTGQKMKDLTEQLAAEADAADKRAKAARGDAKGKSNDGETPKGPRNR